MRLTNWSWEIRIKRYFCHFCGVGNLYIGKIYIVTCIIQICHCEQSEAI